MTATKLVEVTVASWQRSARSRAGGFTAATARRDSISAPTHVCEIRGLELRSYEVGPETLRAEAAFDRGSRRRRREDECAHRARGLDGPAMVPHTMWWSLMPAQRLLSGAVSSLRDGADMARNSSHHAQARRKLEELIAEATQILDDIVRARARAC